MTHRRLLLVLALFVCLPAAPVAGVVVTFDFAPPSSTITYTEAGMTANSHGHFHTGDSNFDGSPDLLVHEFCCETPAEFTVASGAFDLVSIDVALNGGGPHRFQSSSGALQIVTATSGTFVFPVTGWSGITSFTWTEDPSGRMAIDNLKFCTPPEADTDGDGRRDSCDNCPATVNPEQFDCDRDGAGDACDPDAVDTDGDAIDDACDNCPSVVNTGQEDVDSDGVGDACDPCVGTGPDDDGDGRCGSFDNCPTVANPLQEDADNDGFGDACDTCPGFGSADADGDAVCDEADNCPDVLNADQSDTDFDGFGDVCDGCVGFGDVDSDGDLRCDPIDNCPDIPNADQADADFDGAGDACDPCFGFFPDGDSDGFCDDTDNCPLIANPDQGNADGDDLGNVCDADDDNDALLDGNDNCPLRPNPEQENLDGDSDGDACDPDVDGDGADNVDDNCPLAPNAGQADDDGDGVGNPCDNCPTIANPAAGLSDLTLLLEDLNAHSGAIASLVPSRFNFTEGETGNIIFDGGNDMYDGGNILNTDLAFSIAYTNGVITPSDALFGTGSSYFTEKFEGLFVLAVADSSVDVFQITGNNGADGGGNVDGATLSTTVQGLQYTVFVKRVFNAFDPSINHIIIVPGNGTGIAHTFASNTNDDLHTVTGLSTVDSFFYLLVARANGARLADTDILAIVETFVGQGSQPDQDGDGIGDPCDPCVGAGTTDSDGDGACDSADPCPSDPLDGCVNLYGCATASNGLSSLYRINPATGSGTLIGPMGIEGCSGLSFQPTTGTLYAVGTHPDTAADSLWTVNTVTGAATLIGPVGPGAVSDIDFSADGTLYFVRPSGLSLSLGTLNLLSGAGVAIGTSAAGGSGHGLAFAGDDNLLHANNSFLRRLDQSNGSAILLAPLGLPPVECSNPRINAMSFAGGVLFGSLNCSAPPVHLVTINTVTGAVTLVGPTVPGLDGLAFRRTPAPALDHYTCYQGKDLKDPAFEPMSLEVEDDLTTETVEVQKLKYVCVPTSKAGEGIVNASAYMSCYQVKGAVMEPRPRVEVSTQFQTSRLELKKPRLLCLPSTLNEMP